MEDRTLAALIDQYLLGSISPQDKSTLEHLMETDPTVAEAVSDSRLAFKALQLERNRRLKAKLRELDDDELKRQGFYSSTPGIVTISLIVFFLLFYMISNYFSVESIAGRNLEPYVATDHTTMGYEETEEAWKEAEQAFSKKEYELAILRYGSLSAVSDKEPADVAKWNQLMARLAVEGPTPYWKQSLDLYIKETPGQLGKKALKLSGFLESGFGRFLTRQFEENFSSIKPRLI